MIFARNIRFWLPMALLALPAVAWAQDTSRVALPNIAPREVEIRGTLEVSLPSLQRQPLVGFNPPPEVPRPPAGRRPFVEAYKQASNELPESPLRRPPPPSALGAVEPPAYGQVESLVGRYFSRSVAARLRAPLSDRASFILRADYRGSDGHEPFDALDDYHAPYDAFEGSVGVQTSGDRWAAGFTLSGFGEEYDLFGLLPNDPLIQTIEDLRFDRVGRGGGGALSLTTLGDVPVEARLDLRYDATRYETRPSLTTEPNRAFTEQRFGADVEARLPISTGDVWADGSASAASLEANLGTYSAAEFGGGFLFELASTFNVRLGARLLAVFSDTDRPRADAERSSRGYVSPDVSVEWQAAPGLRLYAHNRPGVNPNAVADVFRINPYLTSLPLFRPSLRDVDAEVGGSLFVGPVELSARGGYRHFPQMLFFENEAAVPGRTVLRYAEAEVIHGGGSVSVNLTGSLHAMLGLAYRDGRLPSDDGDDTEIPYFAPLVGEATLSYAFARRRGLLQLTGYLEGARTVSRASDRRLDPYLDLDAEASYKITRALAAVLRIENISGASNTRWDNYPESPLVVGVGLRVNW